MAEIVNQIHQARRFIVPPVNYRERFDRYFNKTFLLLRDEIDKHINDTPQDLAQLAIDRFEHLLPISSNNLQALSFNRKAHIQY